LTEPRIEQVIPVLPVANLDRGVEFYGKLGFTLAWSHQLAPERPRLGSVRYGAVELFLTEHRVAPMGAVVYANVTGLDALAARAQAAGLVAEYGPVDQPWGQREVGYRDPDGNLLRLGEPVQADSKLP
jgi:catechol 2,3-dioxygenase-like lactoylglutathione lyase family enzyme